jgi:CheY-like chemotaxis protein
VTQSGGHISIQSEPGRGTTLSVLLPREDAPEDDEEDAAELPTHPGGSETVLLVEDDEQLRTLTGRLLTQQGYRVVTASDGREALLKSTEHTGPIHLLLTDVIMPNMGGFEVARLLSETRPKMRVLFVSGYTAESMSQQGMPLQEAHFLAKPVEPQTLLRKVREVLDSVVSP